MIKIICFGKIKETFFKEAIKEYQKRISKYTKIEIIELEDYKDDDIKKCLKEEKKDLLKKISKDDNIVMLDIEGKACDSIEFAKFINKEQIYNSNITFLIGSSNGFDDEIKEITNKKISFSKMTFPHQLFRIILLEQIYRAYKIANNESYHK